MQASSTRRDIAVYAAIILGTLAASAVGGLATTPQIPIWYDLIQKPSWTPPNAVFGPAWTVLFVLMAVAAYLVRARSGPAANGALVIWTGQLLLNVLWSVLFFVLHQVAVAFFELLLFWAAILATIIAFRRHSRWAAVMLWPYLAWVTFAGTLNFGVWYLNGAVPHPA